MNGTSTAEVDPRMPQPTPDNPFPTPWPTGPTYSALDLMGPAFFREVAER